MTGVAAALGLVQWLHLAAAMLLFGAEAFVAALVPAGLAAALEVCPKTHVPRAEEAASAAVSKHGRRLSSPRPARGTLFDSDAADPLSAGFSRALRAREPQAGSAQDEQQRVSKRSPKQRRAVATALLVATGLAWAALQAGLMAGESTAAVDPGAIARMLTSTTFGLAWSFHLGLVALVTAATVLDARDRVVAVLAGLALASTGLVGHAAMHDAWLGAAHRLNHMLHLLAGGAWLGALPPLVAVMRRMADPASRADASLALRRFSSAGHAVVAVIIITGALNTVLVTGTILPDASALYGRLLLGKIGLVAAMVWLAVWNRYVLVPSLGRTPTAGRDLERLTIVNIGLGGLVLLVSAVLGLSDPGPP